MQIKQLLVRYKLVLICLGLFFLLFPLANSIGFIQNDEHTRYTLVTNFLAGNFTLDPYISTTFYTQGVLGAIFAFVFGLSKLSILTLVLSVISFYFLVRTLKLIENPSFYKSVLLGLLLFFNPIFIYSTLGFMTEIYFLTFLIISFYFIQKYLSKSTSKNLLLVNLVIVVSYLARQVALITSVAFLVTLLLRKNYKHFFIQLFLTVSLGVFHFFVFPQTAQMKVTQIGFSQFKDSVFIFSIVAVVIIYLVAFFAPAIIAALFSRDLITNKKYWLVTAFLAVVTFWFIQNHFDPLHIVFTYFNREGNRVFFGSSGVFPYFKNIFGREGFLADDFEGTKYNFRGFFDLFRYWNLLGMILAPFGLALMLFKKKNYANFHFLYLVLYGGFLLVMPKIYDRYLLYMFPAFLLFLSPYITKSVKVLSAVFLPFLAFLVFLNYQYSMDFITVQNYVWKTAERLVSEKKATPKEIRGGNSWQALHPNPKRDWKYFFSYDIEDDEEDKCCYKVFEEKKIEFPLSIYVDPKIRMHERVSE